MSLADVQIGCQKRPLGSGHFDENGENDENCETLSAIVKMANLAKNRQRVGKISMTFERGYFDENDK